MFNIKVKRIISVLILSTLFTLVFSACGNNNATTKIKIKSLTENEVAFSSVDYHTSNSKDLIYVTKSGLIELYYNSVNYSVAIKDTSTGKVWNSLPERSQGDEKCDASVVSMKVSKDDQVFYLNSQDNSVAFSSASFKPTSTGIQVTYDMALSQDVAQKSFESVSDGELYISVTVVYTLSDGAFSAKISCGDMMVSNGYVIETVDLMNYFGATAVSQQDDFIFVPDGSGAIIDIGSKSVDEYETRNYKVYGNDIAVSNELKTDGDKVYYADAFVPAFGFKSSSSAVLGVILGGDTISTVSSHRYTQGGTYNRVGASFRLTDVSYSGSENRLTKHIAPTYSGEINISYRFLSNKNADYVGLASACREMLIRKSVLSSDTVSSETHLPFALTIQGSVSKNSATSYTKLSDFAQTYDLLNLMKAKNINSINLRYMGLLDGANNQSYLSKVDVISALGNKKDFQKLNQYVKTQKFGMFLNLDLLEFNKNSVSVAKNGAESLTGDNLFNNQDNQFSAISGKQQTKMYYTRLSTLSDNVLSFFNRINSYDFDGYCIDDAGSLLYSDFSDETHNRSNAVNMLSSQVAILANSHKIMIDTGNFYMLKNADVVADLPYNTTYPETQSYIPVPFVQVILHGIVDYSMQPINLAQDSKVAFLKSVEYGAMPSYEWICTKTDSDEINGKYYYENQLATAVENYTVSDKTIGDLRNARMTAHYKVQDGVYCTEYNNSIVIYFNYNETSVTVNSMEIKPLSCLRVN